MRIGRTALVLAVVGVAFGVAGVGVSAPAGAGSGGDSDAEPLTPKASGQGGDTYPARPLMKGRTS